MKNLKFNILLLAGLLASAVTSAQTTAAAAPAADTFLPIMTLVLGAIVGAIFISAVWMMVRTNALLYKKVMESEYQARGLVMPGSETAQAAPQEDWWEKFLQKYWENPVPIEREKEIMGHHEFDGIRELDNNLPPWWINMFYATIVFSGIYMYYYDWGGSDWSSTNQYNTEMEVAAKEKSRILAASNENVTEENVTRLTESGPIGEGELIYKNVCVACHGPNGEGGVGPNMTDEYWLHGGGIKNVFKTIKYGVPEKGMIAWAAQLKPSDMQKVASYILTMQGTKPANPKEPQGTIWNEAVSDTAKVVQAAAGK